MDPSPAKEYESRQAHWKETAERYDRRHQWAGDLRLVFLAALVLAAILLRNTLALGVLFAAVVIGLFLSGMVHDRILRRRDAALGLAAFYQAGLDRLAGHWAGKGSPGNEFLDKEHPYAIDLDIFGAGSVFELINSGQTKAGRSALAQWLLTSASPGEILARQDAVRDLRPKLDLRENLALRMRDARAYIDTDALASWAAQPPAAANFLTRAAAFCLPLIAWSLFAAGKGQLFVVMFAIQGIFARFHYRRTSQTVSTLKLSAPELRALSGALELLEQEDFAAPSLKNIKARFSPGGLVASASLRKVERLVDWMDARNNTLFAVIGPLLLLKMQFAFALESWRAHCGPQVPGWLSALGEMEATSSIGGYAYEHPGDAFPELTDDAGSPLMVAEGLAHPLIPETVAVRNDIALDAGHPLHVISGSNMSGKSTWLRAIGTNAALAMAGAPVRARKFRITPLQIGALIRTMDSLQEGVSRFYAEIKRLRQIVELAGQSKRVVFLIDEMLSGTNSHDREIGAASVAKALAAKGAIGLITTHDLALTRIVEEIKPPGVNYHFEDQLTNGKLSFDYTLRPGVVQKSNALDLMRLIGLDV